MKVLVVTNMYPTTDMPAYGCFVRDQVVSLRDAGTTVHVLFINGRRSRWNYLLAPVRVWRALMRGRYDLVHAQHVLAGVIARAQWTHRLVLTHHGCEVLGHPPWQARLCRLVSPLCDHVIYVSEEQKKALRDADGSVIPCGVDLGAFAPSPQEQARDRAGLPRGKRLVLWVGDPARPEKRFSLAREAMDRVVARMQDAELIVLAGKSHREVPDYMNGCDVLLLTSLAEGSPMVVKEAMACNLPIVSVPVGDVERVVGGTRGCALVPADAESVSEALVTILRDPQRTDGRARVEGLRKEAVARRVLEVYEQTVHTR